MNQQCRQCSASFQITPDDLAFYEKVSPVFNGKKELIPPPTMCPECRQILRCSFRNERSIFHRKCDFTGRQIISMYAPESPYTVYQKDEWYGDKWDPLSYGKEFDFGKPFFQQFKELKLAVPRMHAVQQRTIINSDYCNRASDCKNCYLCFSSSNNEDCYYGTNTNDSKNCVDGYNVQTCELCYECVECYDCYASAWLESCKNCMESYFLKNCTSCKHCLFCTNLVQKEYCIFNKQYTKEEYEKELKGTNFGSSAVVETLKERFAHVKSRMIVKAFTGVGNENVSGHCLDNCKNTFVSFDCKGTEDCSYLQSVVSAKDCRDLSYWGRDTELVYYTHGCGYQCRNVLFCNECWEGCSDIIYCDSCMQSQHLLGCIGLRHRQYCILNQQYTKEEYEALAPKIVAHMRNTKEWGEFFTMDINPFAYNESVAYDYFPLSKKEVLRRGWRWMENDDGSRESYMGPATTVPDAITDAPDDITKNILRCSVTGKPFKVTQQELKFYRQMSLPIPRKCPDQRHKERMDLRNPRKLWDRNCAKCKKPIATSYAPERPEIVYCETCYLSTVY